MKWFIAFLASISAGFAGDIKLPSGRLLKDARIGPIVFTSGAPSALHLNYHTTVDINSQKAVSEEVTEVWKIFRVDVEKAKYRSAIIGVTGPGSGFIVKSAEQRNFVFTLKDDGTWEMLLPAVWQTKKPNKALEPTPMSVTPPAAQESRRP